MAANPPKHVEVVSLTIPSRLELLGILDKVADSLCQRLEFSEEARSDVTMSVIEAGTNAIQHGHNVDPLKDVDVRFEMHPDHLAVVVIDRGRGFKAPECSPDVTTPEHLLDLRGRGIFIMRSCMDKVIFESTDGGTTVRLIKLLKPGTNGSPPNPQ